MDKTGVFEAAPASPASAMGNDGQGQGLEMRATALPQVFLNWQLETRRAMYRTLAAGNHPSRHPAHLPVMITFNLPGEAFPVRVANKGAALTPRDEVLSRYIALLEETLTRCQGRPWADTLPERVAAVQALLDAPQDIDPRRLGFLEIFEGGTYANLQRDPRVILHYTGEGPHYPSFQINARAEIAGPGDPRYRFLALSRRIFEGAPFHIPQTNYAASYLVWVEEVLDKTPYPVKKEARRPEITFREILVPADNSRYSTWATNIALQIAGKHRSTLVGNHVYAARLHDRRFKDMEPGLPDRYQEETILAHQRELHDTLIGQGLKLISDSYLEAMQRQCREAGVAFVGKTPEGKNYTELVRDIQESGYDLVVMGARGFGEVWHQGERQHTVIGSVCERVTRRVDRDVLVVKNDQPLGGTFVVGIDGSARSFAALRLALALAVIGGARVQAVAAYDPFLHKVLFNELEGALTEQARRVFNTRQQEKLHDELIDNGIAKIYGDHLETAGRIAAEMGVDVETCLLEGKPYPALLRHIRDTQPTLLALGRTGIHADEGLDIGATAENLLRLAPCHVLLVARTFTPTRAEARRAIEQALPWTQEALAHLARVPDFARGMARKAIEDYARQAGASEVDEALVAAAREKFGM